MPTRTKIASGTPMPAPMATVSREESESGFAVDAELRVWAAAVIPVLLKVRVEVTNELFRVKVVVVVLSSSGKKNCPVPPSASRLRVVLQQLVRAPGWLQQNSLVYRPLSVGHGCMLAKILVATSPQSALLISNHLSCYCLAQSYQICIRLRNSVNSNLWPYIHHGIGNEHPLDRVREWSRGRLYCNRRFLTRFRSSCKRHKTFEQDCHRASSRFHSPVAGRIRLSGPRREGRTI